MRAGIAPGWILEDVKAIAPGSLRDWKILRARDHAERSSAPAVGLPEGLVHRGADSRPAFAGRGLVVPVGKFNAVAESGRRLLFPCGAPCGPIRRLTASR